MAFSVRTAVKNVVGAAAVAALAAPLLAAPSSGETLKVAVREFAGAKGNPYVGCICTPAVFVMSAFYQQLTSIGEKGETTPFLAESWKNIDPTTWRFKLRDGVKFSNGEPLNAAAVKATFDYMQTEEGKAFSQSNTINVFLVSTTVVDDLTVEMKTKTPDPLAPRKLGSQSIVAPKAWADVGVAGFVTNPVGTGPYIVTFGPNEANAVPNPLSWKSRADVSEIAFIELPEGAARTQALVSGQIDIDVATSVDAFPTLKAAGMKIYSKPSTRTIGITLVSYRNHKPVEGPLGDVRVRRALNYAVNKQAIVDNIFAGNGRPASQSAVPTANGYNPNIKPYPYDPEKAKQLLAEAGYPNGFDLEVQAITTDANFRLSYEAAVQDLRKIGINANLVSQTFPDFVTHWVAGDWPYEGIGLGHDLGATQDAGRSFAVFSSCLKPSPYYCDKSEVPLIEAASREFDPDKRRVMLQELLEKQAKNAPIIYLVEFNESMAYNPRIKNFSHIRLWIPYEELVLN